MNQELANTASSRPGAQVPADDVRELGDCTGRRHGQHHRDGGSVNSSGTNATWVGTVTPWFVSNSVAPATVNAIRQPTAAIAETDCSSGGAAMTSARATRA